MIFIDSFSDFERYTISSDKLSVSVITLGATVTSVKYKGRETVLSYSDAEGFKNGDAYVNAAIGRYANRISGSKFSLNGREYVLVPNEGKNQLHGGPESYDKRVWTAEAREDSVRFTLFSPDGDNGFPGALSASVTYSVEGEKLRIDFEGESDADTIFAPTSHLYFNLDGSKSVLENALRINADSYLPVDDELIPMGAPLPARGSFDFRTLRPVKENFDHCFILTGSHGCTMEAGGVRMDMFTDMPAVQIYTGSSLGEPFGVNGGLAIEPEFYPDSPNRPDFPSTVLKRGERFHKYAVYAYSEI